MKDRNYKMKKCLVVAGLLILAAGGFYGWRLWAQNEEMYHSGYPNYISDDGICGNLWGQTLCPG